MKKRERYIPSGYVEYKPEIGDYPKDLFACYVKISNEVKPRLSAEAIPEPFYQKFTALFFVGKQSNPNWHYNFPNEEQMKKKINETISRLMSWEDMKQKRKEERKNAILDVKVGDLLVSSWGYDQTNVDFYQVTEVKGKTFTIKRIAGKSVPGSGADYNGMADMVMPVKDDFLDEEKYPPIKKRSFSLNSYSSLSKTDERQKHYRSWYA